MRVHCPALTHLMIDGWDWSRCVLGRILDCLHVRAAHGTSRLEYFGTDGERERWVLEVFNFILKKYHPRFLAVVSFFAVTTHVSYTCLCSYSGSIHRYIHQSHCAVCQGAGE